MKCPLFDDCRNMGYYCRDVADDDADKYRVMSIMKTRCFLSKAWLKKFENRFPREGVGS